MYDLLLPFGLRKFHLVSQSRMMPKLFSIVIVVPKASDSFCILFRIL